MALIYQPLTAKPLADLPELDELQEELTTNVPRWERIGSAALGAGLIFFWVSPAPPLGGGGGF